MKRIYLLLLIAFLSFGVLTGCGKDFIMDESMKDSLTESWNEKTFEIIDIDGMAYFYIDADYVQLVDIDGNPISYENGKNHNLLVRDLDFSNDNKGFTCIVEDSETYVKWLYSCRIAGYRGVSSSVYFYEADTDLILGENGLPKIN